CSPRRSRWSTRAGSRPAGPGACTASTRGASTGTSPSTELGGGGGCCCRWPGSRSGCGPRWPRGGSADEGRRAGGTRMKAIVLVGGEGTRLRPLTETIPKPLLPMMNRAFLHRVLDHLGQHGVHEVVLSSSYLESAFQGFLEERHGDP